MVETEKKERFFPMVGIINKDAVFLQFFLTCLDNKSQNGFFEKTGTRRKRKTAKGQTIGGNLAKQ